MSLQDKQQTRRFAKLWLGLLTGTGVVVLVLLLWSLNLFVGLRLRLSNLFYVSQATSGNIIIVAVDDASIRQYGAYQDWSREIYAQLVDELSDQGARVIAFDILFSEPRDGDTILAESLARALENGVRIVLPAVGIQQNIVEVDYNLNFISELAPIDSLAQHATYTAYVNTFPDVDSTIRRHASTATHEEKQHFSFGLATYLAYLNISESLAPQVLQFDDERLILPNNIILQRTRDGLWMSNFFGEPSEPTTDKTFETLSVYEVLDNSHNTNFEDKIVLIGLMETTGAVDYHATPISNQQMAGVEVNANAIETLLVGAPLQYESRYSQIITIVVLGFLSAVLFVPFRWYWILVLALGIVFVWFLYASIIRFSIQQVVVNPLHPILTIAFSMLASVGMQISYEIRQRQQVQDMLQTYVQVSQQQMEMNLILPLIAEDMKSITKAPAGAVWIPNNKGKLESSHTWGERHDGFSVPTLQAVETKTTQADEIAIAVPVVWHGRVSAVLSVEYPNRRTKVVKRELEEFAQRIAANLENARLFGETQSQNQLLTGILSESPAGILVLDDALNLQRYNGSAAQWLRIDEKLFVGQPISAALEASQIDEETWQKLGENILSQKQFRQEIKVNQRSYQLDASHISGGHRWVITLSDITELAELNQLKTRMIRMASHDLKNPLGRIIGYGELLDDMLDDLEDEDIDQHKLLLGRMIKSAEEMNNIITEILSLDQLRTGRMVLEPLSMVNVAHNVIERYENDAENKRQTLKTDFPDDKLFINGDFNQMVQAVSNLVGNAIKYTPDEGHITVKLCRQDNKVRLEVIDNGYGMPKEAQDSLFTEFYRIRTEKTKSIKGTGLGLSLVKAVIEAHEGKIWVDSELDKGSTFFVELPVIPSPES